MLFDSTIKNINRLRQIIQVLFSYGFEDMITSTTLKNLVPQSRRLSWSRRNKPVFDYSRAERVRMVLEELGPTFIKFGQILSNRPDLLPVEFVFELEKLQNEVPPISFESVKKIIERESGGKMEAVFDYVIERPLGSASIGQVHRARLRSGEEVVVKVQRPNVRGTVQTDVAILKEVVQRADPFFRRQGFVNASEIVLALEETMNNEMSYLKEARNIQQFRNFYGKRKDFYIPKVFKEFSTDKLLVIEFASGCKITNVQQQTAWGIKPPQLARKGLNIYLSQIFDFGFFHADPHPGNIIVREDGVICLLDFGMTGKLLKHDKYAFAGVFIGLAQKNPRKMANSLRRLSTDFNIADRVRLEEELAVLVDSYADLDMEEIKIADISLKLQRLFYDYNLRIPRSVYLILRAMTILDGIGRQLDPGMNIYEEIKPYGARLLKEQYSTQNLVEEASYRLDDFNYLLKNMPSQLSEILGKLKGGKLRLESRDSDREESLKRADSRANRMLLGLMAASAVIGTAIITPVLYEQQVIHFLGMPLFSILGFGLGLFLGAWALLSLIRS